MFFDFHGLEMVYEWCVFLQIHDLFGVVVAAVEFLLVLVAVVVEQ